MCLFIYWTFLLYTIFSGSVAVLQNWQTQWGIMNFTSITHFEGIEAYYQSVRGQRIGAPPRESPRSTMRKIIKKHICRSIFRRYFFKLRGEKFVNIDDKKIYQELKESYRDTFDSIFIKKSKNTSLTYMSGNYKYKNYYTSRTIHALGTDKEEYTFICLVRDESLGTIKKYFVSQPYNVNLVPNVLPIFGRFIFSPSEIDNKSTLIAMAEEETVQVDFYRKSKLSEVMYVATRMNFQLPSTPDTDPLCKLTEANKLRLCSSIYASLTFRKRKIRFKPVMDNVDVECVKKRIRLISPEPNHHRFVGWITRSGMSLFQTYEEWVIGCKAIAEQGDRIIHYVARAELPNAVFVFRPSDDVDDERVTLLNYFMNVSVAEKLRHGEVQSFLANDVED